MTARRTTPTPRWLRRRAVETYAVLGHGPRTVMELAQRMDIAPTTALAVVQYLVRLGDVERITWADDPAHPPGLLFRMYRRIEPEEGTADG